MSTALVVQSAKVRSLLEHWASQRSMVVLVPGQGVPDGVKYHRLLVMLSFRDTPPPTATEREHARIANLWLQQLLDRHMRTGARMHVMLDYDELMSDFGEAP